MNITDSNDKNQMSEYLFTFPGLTLKAGTQYFENKSASQNSVIKSNFQPYD